MRNVLAIEKDQKTAEQYDSTKNTSKTCLNCDDNNWNSEYSAPRMIPDYGEVCNTFHPSELLSEFVKPLSVLHSGLNHNHSFKEFNFILWIFLVRTLQHFQKKENIFLPTKS